MEDEAVVVLKSEVGYIERMISRRRLAAVGADYNGARVRLVVTEEGSSVSARLDHLGDEIAPVWATPDEKMMQTFRQLAAGLRVRKKR